MNNKPTTYNARPGEALPEHLTCVARLSSEFVNEFSDESIGRFIGAIHDVGKYTERFQNVLCHSESNVNHAIISGIVAKDAAPALAKRLGTSITAIIALGKIASAHHSEIDMSISLNRPLSWDDEVFGMKYSVKDDDEYRRICQFVVGLVQNGQLKPFHSSVTIAGEINRMLYERMLLSCLVDADYSAAAEFNDSGYLEKNTKEISESMANALERYHEKLANSARQTVMNDLRNRVYADCSSRPDLESGRLFTLTAPTGTGKTLAMLKFAMDCCKYGRKKRVFTILPFLSVISQTVGEYIKIFGEDSVLEDDSLAETSRTRMELSGRWTSPVVVTTTVKFLESLFTASAPASRKLHNLCNSIVLFDEFQSIPPQLLTATVNALRELSKRYGCVVVFSSASPPNYSERSGLEWWKDEVRELIGDVSSLYYDYGKAKRLEVDANIAHRHSTEEIAQLLSYEKNACVIVNTKAVASEIYEILSNIRNKADCFLISTDLCAEHRATIINEIKQRQSQGKPVCAVSTQCIEAGVDISFDRGWREIAPLEALVQSAGRVARNGGNGKYTVFSLYTEKSPDTAYRNAQRQTKRLIEELPRRININDLGFLTQYYKHLYMLDGFSHDKPELSQAIDEHDFRGVQNAYKVIEERDQVRIIVPYGMRYSDFVQKFETQSGIVSRADIRRIQSITVNTFDKDIAECCRRVKLFSKGDPDGIDTNIYLFPENTPLLVYDEKTGLQKKNSNLMF